MDWSWNLNLRFDQLQSPGCFAITVDGHGRAQPRHAARAGAGGVGRSPEAPLKASCGTSLAPSGPVPPPPAKADVTPLIHRNMLLPQTPRCQPASPLQLPTHLLHKNKRSSLYGPVSSQESHKNRCINKEAPPLGRLHWGGEPHSLDSGLGSYKFWAYKEGSVRLHDGSKCPTPPGLLQRQLQTLLSVMEMAPREGSSGVSGF